jgi:hypothetical protein
MSSLIVSFGIFSKTAMNMISTPTTPTRRTITTNAIRKKISILSWFEQTKRSILLKLKSNLYSQHLTEPPFPYPTHIAAWQASFSKQFFFTLALFYRAKLFYYIQIGWHSNGLLMLLARRQFLFEWPFNKPSR